MKLLLLSFILGGCGTSHVRLSGDTTHTVQGETVTRIVISVDFAVCAAFTDTTKREDCMMALVNALSVALAQNPGAGVVP